MYLFLSIFFININLISLKHGVVILNHVIKKYKLETNLGSLNINSKCNMIISVTNLVPLSVKSTRKKILMQTILPTHDNIRHLTY